MPARVRPSRSVSYVELAAYALLALAWIVVMNSGTSNGIGYFQQPAHNLLWPLISGTVFNAATFFVNALWLIPAYLRKPRYRTYLAALAGLFVVVIGGKTLVDVLIIRLSMPSLAGLSFPTLALENVYIFPAFILFSFIYRFGRDWITHEREKRLLIESRRVAELGLLRAQIGPHFLFNTLNNLYSLGLRGKTEEVTGGIAKLSQLLRYILHDSQKPTVSLADEIGYIESVLDLGRLAVEGDDIAFHIDLNGEAEQYRIAPMLLFPFVENAFEHGVGVDGRSFVHIKLGADRGKVEFSVANSIAEKRGDADTKSTGLGLDNVRQRLALLYPNAHELSVNRKPDEFRIHLRLALTPE